MLAPAYKVGIALVAGVPAPGSFTDVTSDVLRFDVSRKVAALFSPLTVGDATVELANDDGRYSPLNAAGPYYPNLRSQRQLTIAASFLGNALLQSAASQQVLTSVDSGFNAQAACAAEAWLRQDAGGPWGALEHGLAGAPNTHQLLYLDINRHMNYRVAATQSLAGGAGAGGNLFTATDPSTFGVGSKWHFLGTFTGSYVALYSSGALVSSVSVTASLCAAGSGTGPMTIGALVATSGTAWNGALDEVYYWGRGVTNSEAAEHAVGSFSNLAGLLGYWGFDEDIGLTAYDGTSRGNDATVLGGAARAAGICPVQSYAIFKGWIKEFHTSPMTGKRTAIVTAQDVVNRLDNTFITTSLFQNTNPASLFTAVMSLCGVSSFSADALPGDLIQFAYFRDANARTAVQDILNFGYYKLAQDGAGTLTLRNRYFGILGLSVQTLSQFADFTLIQNEDQLLNSVKIQASPRRTSATVNTVTWLQQKLAIPASSSIGFWLTYVDPVAVTVPTPASSLTVPVASADFLCNAQSDGAGTDLTNQQSVTCTFYGEAAVCSMFNGTGNVAIVNKFQIRGFSAQQQPTISSVQDDGSSQAVYGKHQLAFADDLLWDKVFMDSYAQGLVLDRKEERPVLTFNRRNDWRTCLPLDVGQLVSVVESLSGVNSQWTITGVRHSVALAQGLEHVFGFDAEYYNDKRFFILDDPVRGTLDAGNVLTF